MEASHLAKEGQRQAARALELGSESPIARKMVGVLALSPGVNTRAGAWHKRKEIGSLSLENWSPPEQTRDTAGATGALATLAAGWETVNSQRMLLASMRPGEAAQVLGERQPAQEQGRASS